MKKMLALLLVLNIGPLGGCGGETSCPDGFARDNDDNCIALSDSSNGQTGSNSGGGGGTNNTSGGGGNNLKPIGGACEESGDCNSGLCIFQNGYDVLGVCTESCDSWSDCSESFWECCDLSNGGFVCAPDSWVDELGLQCD